MPRFGVSLKSLAKDERPTDTLGVARRLFGYLLAHRYQLSMSVVWILVTSATTAAQPALIGITIDRAVEAAGSTGDGSVLVWPIIGLVAAAVFGWWTQRSQILLLGDAGQRALFALRAEVFAALQRLSVAFFDDTESGDLMSRLINDIEQVNSFLSQGFRRVLSSVLGLTATLVAMVLVDYRLALATLIVLPFMWATTRLFAFFARKAFRARQESIGDVSATLAEELAGIKVAQAFNRTEANRGQFTMRNAANRDANITASAVSSAFSPVLSIISTAATALVAVYGGWLALADAVTIGVVVAFFNYARQFFNAVSQLSSLYAETQSALAGGERVFALIDMKPDVTDSADAIDIGKARGSLEFRGVSFAYRIGPEVLHAIDLVIEPGTSVAIVGPTGAGKTTFVNLVPRFYDPTAGAVLLDGHDLRDLTTASVRANLGIVLQEPFLFSGTIAENILYGRLDATEEEVMEAAQAARAADFIQRLPEGLHTQIGERGATLSTGQRQLIAFARAILSDPAILILDEATSSVDTRTETLIQEALRRILAGRTALIIAHRLSTVRDADRIVVLENGRIAEEGSYRDLLDAGGAFARLHSAQFEE